MNEVRHLTCIKCPIGCQLEVTLENGEVIQVKGNECIRGEQYAKIECVRPTRTLTSILPVVNGVEEMVSVKSSREIPKELLLDAMKLLRGLKVEAPIQIGDVILVNILNTGVDLIATKAVKRK